MSKNEKFFFTNISHFELTLCYDPVMLKDYLKAQNSPTMAPKWPQNSSKWHIGGSRFQMKYDNAFEIGLVKIELCKSVRNL